MRIDRNKKAFGKRWKLIHYCQLLDKNSRDISTNIWNFSCFSRGILFGKHRWKVALAGACLAEMAAVTFGHYWSACKVPVGHRPMSPLQFCTLVAINQNTTAEVPLSLSTVCLHCLLCVYRGQHGSHTASGVVCGYTVGRNCAWSPAACF